MIKPHSLEAVNDLYNIELAHGYISEYDGDYIITWEDFIRLRQDGKTVEPCCPFNKDAFNIDLAQRVYCRVLMEARNQADPATKIEVAMRLRVLN